MEVDLLRTTVDDDHRIEISAWEEGLLGTARVEEIRSRKPHLVDLYVRKNRRREGIGRALVQSAMEWAGREDRTLFLEVDPKNRRALLLYRSLGWDQIGMTKDNRRQRMRHGTGPSDK